MAPGSPTNLAVQVFAAKSFSLPHLSFPSYQPVAAQQLALPLLTLYGPPPGVLDVDGDGHLDLLAGNTVAYGNGDGTFGRIAVLPALASGYSQTYAIDIDGDGKTDIVAVNTPPSTLTPGTVQYAFTVFHNNGGGSFTAMGPYPLAASFAAGSSVQYNIFGLSFADVNGDGRVDVLSQSNAIPLGNAQESAQLNVMLNTGSGFSAPQAVDTSSIPDTGLLTPAFADLNGDGKQDIVFSYQTFSSSNGVATLLGNGDGTFAAPMNFPIGSMFAVGSTELPLVVEDVNGDGKPDAVLGSGVLLMGNGDGTFRAGTALFPSTVAAGSPPPAYAVLAAPPTATIPGGEDAPLFALVFVDLQPGADAVFVPNTGSTATVTVALARQTAYSLTAQYSGDAVYRPSVSSPPFGFELGTTRTTLTVTSSASSSFVGGTAVITAAVSGLAPGGGGTINFTQGSTVTPVALQNGTASYTAAFSATGTETISAAYSGDAQDAPAAGSVSIAVGSPISMPAPSSTTLTVASGSAFSGSITVNAIAGYSGMLSLTCSGLPVDASCSFTPQVPTIQAPSGNYGFIVATSSAATVLASADDSAMSPRVVAWCGGPMLGLLLMGRIRRSRVVRLLLVLCAGIVVTLSGCGGGSKPTPPASATFTPPGTYSFQVNAIADGSTVSQSYTLVVQ